MILSMIGAAMIAASAYGIATNTATAKLKHAANTLFMHTKAFGEGKVRLKNVRRKEDVLSAEITLPYNVTADDIKKHIKALEQATNSYVRYKQLYGATFELQFGYAPFHENMPYDYDKLPVNGLKIPLYTPFGLKNLDFGDETCCHLLQGGATRMGKSAFLRYVVTHLMRSTDGHLQVLFIDHKVTDLYMFQDVPQIKIAETQGEAKVFLEDVLTEVERRKKLLKSKKKVVDMKQFRQLYPNEKVDPIFVVIDEYGRFADNDTIQEIVTEIAETAGYVDVHLIISSQRPDARDVLKPRIKANILTRLSFATSDETNSKIILDLPDAANIGKIQGRGILLDGFVEHVQVPFVSADRAYKIMEQFRSEENGSKGSENLEVSEALSGAVEGSDRVVSLPGSGPAVRNSESDNETPNTRRVRAADPTSEGSPIPVHDESDDHSPAVTEDRSFPWLGRPIHSTETAKNIRSGAKRKR